LKRAIGVIDSGVGGLTVAYEIMRQLPNEQIFYVGDTLRCPYGPRPQEEVIQYTREMVQFLIEKNIKMLVIACNTATAFALDAIEKEFPIPVVGVIQPGVRAAIKSTRSNKIGVIGTDGTINSNAYPETLRRVNQAIRITSLSCPLFVPIVEKGVTEGVEAEKIVYDSLRPFLQVDIDTLVLGCTHYPLLENTIQKVLGDEIKLISSSEETARETSTILQVHDLLYPESRSPKHQFFTTGNVNNFKKVYESIFKREPQYRHNGTFQQITLPV